MQQFQHLILVSIPVLLLNYILAAFNIRVILKTPLWAILKFTMRTWRRHGPVSVITVPMTPNVTDSFCFSKFATASFWPGCVGFLLILHYLHAQSFGNMKGNMTMHEPCSRIVGFEGDNYRAISW